MNLVKFVGVNKICNDDVLEIINNGLQNRLNILELQEPDSDGVVYDTWQEKCDDIEELLESVKEIKTADIKLISSMYEELTNDIKTYQLLHGGLKRISL